jgi:hypothetical protein
MPATTTGVFDKNGKSNMSRWTSRSSFNRELKHMKKGKIELPWDDFFSPAQRACGRRFF